jgi:hypothetical protein
LITVLLIMLLCICSSFWPGQRVLKSQRWKTRPAKT